MEIFCGQFTCFNMTVKYQPFSFTFRVHLTGYSLQIDLMSGINAYARCRKETKGLIISSFRRVLGKKALRDRWLPVELLRDYIHSKYSLGYEIEFKTMDMIWELSKLLPNTLTMPNHLEIEDGIEIDIYRHSFQCKKQHYFFYCTVQFGVLPTFPRARSVCKSHTYPF